MVRVRSFLLQIWKYFAIVITTIAHCTVTIGSDVGVVYSPLVQKGDQHNTQYYTREMVKFMLNVVLDAGYHSVTTYGVGSPNKPYDNQSISECSSFVHTAMAAAEINKEKNHLAMTLYQGMYNSVYEDQANCEIEVGLEIALQANHLYMGTVPAVLYPSSVNFNELWDNAFISDKFRRVSARARALNLKFGVRILDCTEILTKSPTQVKALLVFYDFIICLLNPDENKFKFGIESFENSVILIISQVEDFLKNRVNISGQIVELETGWPGDPALNPPNSVTDLTNYWTEITEWAVKNGKRVYLHEAFDSPWKDTLGHLPLAAHFGRWEYNVNEPNLLSVNAYIKKQDTAKPLFSNFGLPQIGTLTGVVVLVTLASVITILYNRVRRIERVTSALSEQDIKMFFEGETDEDGEYVGEIWEKSPYDNSLEFLTDQIKMDKTDAGLLGKGQFGCVYRGELLTPEGTFKPVAVKMTRPESPISEVKCLLIEIKILTYVGSYAYICSILGASTKEISKGNVCFAMELCTHGNLEGYLRKHQTKFTNDLKATISDDNAYVEYLPYIKIICTHHRNDLFTMSETQLVRWSYEIASAMNFISSKNVIHSDLAARNVLLTADYTTRVTDFGLSRRVLEEDPNYAKTGNEPLPWKWLSPESLEFKRFSSKTDCWSFAVTLWEIFSLGASPRYASVLNWNDLVSHLKSGKRLCQPEFASKEIYKIMTECWSLDPLERPSFGDIIQSLISIIDCEYQDLAE